MRTGGGGLRIAYLDHCAQVSGGEIALANLLPVLPVGAIVVVAEDGPMVDRFRAAGADVVVMPLRERTRSLARHRVGLAPVIAVWDTAEYVVRLTRWLRRNPVDLVHTNSLKAAVYGVAAAKLAGIPVVCHVRDRIADDYLPRLAVRWLRLFLGRVPNAVITNSQATLETLGAPRATVVPSPVPDPIPARGDHRNTGGRRLVMVGRIARWKGQDVLVRAVDEAFPDRDVEVVIVGAPMFGGDDDVFASELRSLVSDRRLDDVVTFAGFVDDVHAHLQRATVFVHASVVPEPFGQVVFEAMAEGVPVIATAAGGPAEHIVSGDSGLLVEAGDVAALAAALRQLLDDEPLRRRLAAGGRKVVAGFAPERVAGQIMSVYGSALSPGGGRTDEG